MRFVDLFAGMGGFHRALTELGHDCVFASDVDEELRELYALNFPMSRTAVHGDIRESKGRVPRHDILCAGFPCQPFSKSGGQDGTRDRTRGTLFHEILEILKVHRPEFVILENVGNFERHNSGTTWRIVRESLVELGYDVRGTTHIASGGHGLISPHHLGFPHTRERFFIVASRAGLTDDPFPPCDRNRRTSLSDVIQPQSELSGRDLVETRLSQHRVACIEHWNKLLRRLPPSLPLPSFPIWGDEIDATYPFESTTPHFLSLKKLRRHVRGNGVSKHPSKAELMALLPSYARTPDPTFPRWKALFIQQNREWFASIRGHLGERWIRQLRQFPASLRKLEWNCQGEERTLWSHVLQFRPSGLRAKRYTSCPALVAMTDTQIPILGPRRRHITRIEGLRLQGFPDSHRLPRSRQQAFAALGNAVHVGVTRAIAQRLLAR